MELPKDIDMNPFGDLGRGHLTPHAVLYLFLWDVSAQKRSTL